MPNDDLTFTQLLDAARRAFNQIPNTPLRGRPYGIADTYALAAALDQLIDEVDDLDVEND